MRMLLRTLTVAGGLMLLTGLLFSSCSIGGCLHGCLGDRPQPEDPIDPADAPNSAQDGRREAFRVLQANELMQVWWFARRNKGCIEVDALKEDPESEKLRIFHPWMIKRTFEACVPEYADQVDLLLLDCSKTKIGTVLLFSSTRESCERHHKKMQEFLHSRQV